MKFRIPSWAKGWMGFSAIVALTALTVGVVVTVLDATIQETDSGVGACYTMAAMQETNVRGTTWTKAEYEEIRGEFAASKHAEIRQNGTALVDTMWQMQREAAGGAGGGTAMIYAAPLMAHWSGLRTACRNEGVPLETSR